MEGGVFCNIIITNIDGFEVHVEPDVSMKGNETSEEPVESLSLNQSVNALTENTSLVADPDGPNLVNNTDHEIKKGKETMLKSAEIVRLSQLLKKVQPKVGLSFVHKKITKDLTQYKFFKQLPLKAILVERSFVERRTKGEFVI